MVVYIHTPFGVLKDYFLEFPVLWGAVPIFFLVAGYFFYSPSYEKCIETAKKRAWQILCLWMALTFLYYPLDPIMGTIQTHYWEYIKLCFFGRPGVFGHLWYLTTAFWAFLFFVPFFKMTKGKFMELIPLGFITAWIFGRYFFFFMEHDSLRLIFNAFSYSMPLIALGYCIRKYEERLLCIQTSVLWVGLLVSMVMAHVEMHWLKEISNGLSNYGPYIFTLPTVVFAFLLCAKHKSFGEGTWWSKFGEVYSSNTYYFHMFAIVGLRFLAKQLGWSDVYYLYGFLATLPASILFGYLAVHIQERVGLRIFK